MEDLFFSQDDVQALAQRVEALEKRMEALEKTRNAGKQSSVTERLRMRTLSIYKFANGLSEEFGVSTIMQRSGISGLTEHTVGDSIADLRTMGLVMCRNEKCWGRGASYFTLNKTDAPRIIADFYNKKPQPDGVGDNQPKGTEP